MGTHLGNVELIGEDNTHPDMPNRNIKGSLTAEPSALVFQSNRFSLAIPWPSISDCDWTNKSIGGLRGMASDLMFLGLVTPMQSLVWVAWYDVENQLGAAAYFKAFNWLGGDTYTEGKAKELVKAIKREKSRYIKNTRTGTTIHSSSE